MAKGDKISSSPSAQVSRMVPMNCKATVGQVGNIDHENVHIGKAGRKRHMGIRPGVRGSAMNGRSPTEAEKVRHLSDFKSCHAVG